MRRRPKKKAADRLPEGAHKLKPLVGEKIEAPDSFKATGDKSKYKYQALSAEKIRQLEARGDVEKLEGFDQPDTEDVFRRFGFVPNSVWDIKEDYNLRKLIGDKKEAGPRALRRRDAGLRGVSDYPYSEFSPVIARRCITYWSNRGDTVLDPFMGRATRGFVATRLGRNYIGYDVAPKTVAWVREKIKEYSSHILAADQAGTWQVHQASGVELAETPDNSVDLIFTCPPYWTVERYESAPGQLSDIENYQIFLSRIQRCWRNQYRKLKKGKFAIWVVGDIRDSTKRIPGLIPFSSHVIQAAVMAHFCLWDIIIHPLKGPWLLGASTQAKTRITVKQHEYILVFKKL